MSRLVTDRLNATSMTKRYGNVTVLDGVDFDVRSGEVHALLGANGAGKSTLCKLISGLVDTTTGQMLLDGKAFAPTNKQDAESRGVQIVQQELNLIPTLNVAENLFLAHLPSKAGMIRSRALHRQARRALDRLQLFDIDSHAPVSGLGVGEMQMVEIAAALAFECQLLILDEPTAALSGTETQRLFEQLEILQQQGVGIVYISHRLDEVKRIADRVTVLRDGRKVTTEPVADVSTDQMVELMGGHATPSEPPSEPSRSDSASLGGEPADVLVVDSLSCGMVDQVSFRVRGGEKFGIAGLIGSGRTELVRAIFGADVATSGGVRVAGGPAERFRHPAQAVAAGLAMLTEDRKETGLLLGESIVHNTTLTALAGRFSRRGWIHQADERRVTGGMCDAMKTRCTSIDQIVGTLSGGNQQKVVIAKWLTQGADVFLFDEPTRGIDVGARRLIYKLFDQLADEGKGIVIVSSDLDELFETCDRIGVMSAGRMVQVFQRGSWSEEAILQASFSGHRMGESDAEQNRSQGAQR